VPEKPRDFHDVLAQDLNLGGALSTFATIGVASAVCLAARRNRRRALFVNTSVNLIFLAKGQDAVIGSGIPIVANGGSWEETPDTLGYLWRGSFSAIAAGAGSNLAIQEEF